MKKEYVGFIIFTVFIGSVSLGIAAPEDNITGMKERLFQAIWSASGWTDDGNVVRLTTSTDKVGIGTASPSTKLHVEGSSAGVIRARSTSGVTNIEVWSDGTGAWDYSGIALTNNYYYPTTHLQTFSSNHMYPNAFKIWHYPDAPIIFGTNNSERMRITGAGNVGIGTTSPLFSLDIRKEVSGEVRINLMTTNRKTGQINRRQDRFEVLSSDSIGFSTNGAPERMRITSDGNIGIGTTSPQSALQVSGYTQIDVLASAPPSADCDAESEAGRMKFDATNDLLYICSGASGWVSK